VSRSGVKYSHMMLLGMRKNELLSRFASLRWTFELILFEHPLILQGRVDLGLGIDRTESSERLSA